MQQYTRLKKPKQTLLNDTKMQEVFKRLWKDSKSKLNRSVEFGNKIKLEE